MRGIDSESPRIWKVVESWPAKPESDAPIANTSRFSCSLVRVAVPSCAVSATNWASPPLPAGSTASPDFTVSIADTLGTVA